MVIVTRSLSFKVTLAPIAAFTANNDSCNPRVLTAESFEEFAIPVSSARTPKASVYVIFILLAISAVAVSVAIRASTTPTIEDCIKLAFVKDSPSLLVRLPAKADIGLKPSSPTLAASCPNLWVSSIASAIPKLPKPNFPNALSIPLAACGNIPNFLFILDAVSSIPSKPSFKSIAAFISAWRDLAILLPSFCCFKRDWRFCICSLD